MDAPSESVDGLNVSPTTFDFEEVFRAQYGHITRVIAQAVRDYGRSEELAAEVFWETDPQPARAGRSKRGWLHRTAVRSRNKIRREGRQARYERLFGAPRAIANPEEAHAAAEQQRVRSLLAAIDQRQAELLILRNEGFSYQDLASTLDLNFASVGTYLNRVQQAFRKEYFKRYA